jgi:DNA-binding MarR family transcriptional regulator
MKVKTGNELLTECACFDLRRTTRAVSRMYDNFLRDAGLNITQFSLLRLICVEKDLSISTIGRYMVMDRTSITRALAPLERDRLIYSRAGADKRIRIISVTNKGRKLVESAEPKWRQAQEALMDTIGEDRWRAMSTVLRDTTRMVRH